MVEATSIVELLEFNYSSFFGTAQTIPDHLHHFYQFDVILSGQVTVKIEGEKPLFAKTGDTWLIPPLIRHGYEIRTPFRQASFKFHLAPRCWNALGRCFMRHHVSRELRAIVEAVGKRHKSQSSTSFTQAIAILTLCLAELADDGSKNPAQPDSLDSFRSSLWPLLEQIATMPHDGWTVSRMALACHLSPDYFSRCFHQVLGQTPQNYIHECRMRSAAATILADPSRPIKDIAEEAHYATVHSFSRAFRNVTGSAPAAYRRTRHAL